MLESKASFARRKGWNRSTATRYADAGKLVMTEQGLVDVEASEARLAAAKDPLKEGVRQRHAAQRRGQGHREPHAPGGEDHDLRPNPNDTSYQLLTKHRAAAELSRSELLRLELEEKEGKLVDANAVRRHAMLKTRQARDAIMNLRYRIDPLLAGESDPEKRLEIWDRECRQICEQLARSTETITESDDGGG